MRADWRAAVLWLGLWLAGLAGLTQLPGSGGSGGAPYYGFGQSYAVYQDLEGAHSVVVRAIRPAGF